MKKYLEKYGIHVVVEVFIIVVGVLIALQVNNWNESRKEKQQLKSILGKIMEDWASDTIMANTVLNHYEPFEEAYDKVIKQELTDEYLDTCRVCRGLVTFYMPYKAESSGLDLLKRYVNSSDNTIHADTTINGLIHSYSYYIETLNQMSERIKDDVDINVLALTEKTWFADLYSKGHQIPEFRTYYKSQEFRNRVARHSIFVRGNLLRFLKQYKKEIIEDFDEVREKYDSL